jgi:hypothetical protein
VAESFSYGSSTIEDGLKDVSRVLFDWRKNILGDLQKRTRKAKKELAACLRAPLSDNTVQREHVLRYRLEKLEEQKNIYWKQRALVLWLPVRRSQHQFFFMHVPHKGEKNRIQKLRREDGQ